MQPLRWHGLGGEDVSGKERTIADSISPCYNGCLLVVMSFPLVRRRITTMQGAARRGRCVILLVLLSAHGFRPNYIGGLYVRRKKKLFFLVAFVWDLKRVSK